MIYLTGDCHGDFYRFTKRQRLKLPFLLGDNDYVIVCGDLGLLWAKDGEFAYNLEWLSRLPFTILWVQGNHENYDLIAEYPMEMWHGGKVRHIARDKIILLERGQVFCIEGKNFFTFGGASSHDVEGGILDMNSPTYAQEKKAARKSGLSYRIKGISWWEQELPSLAEIQEARKNLSNVGYCVDYVVTHCLSSSMQDLLTQYPILSRRVRSSYKADILTDFFDELEKKLKYKQWYCGHYHVTFNLDDKHAILYKDIVPLVGL